MPRFKANRWWTFILALCVLSALAISRPIGSFADPTRDGTLTPGGDTSGGGGPPLPGIGDPDSPVGGMKKGQLGGISYSRNATNSLRSVGDSRLPSNVWMWRLSVMARVLRISWIRY
jgi:hypothetical protein